MDVKQKVEWTGFSMDIIRALPDGILLTTKNGDEVNSMTIGWATIGMCWGKPVFQAFVREHRYTMEMLEKNPEFTVNVPLGTINKKAKKIAAICGSNHGNEMDKIKEAGLTPVESDIVAAPGFKEMPLTLECRVLYKQLQDMNAYPADIAETFYPQDVDSSAYGANKDAHVMIIAELLNTYLITE